MLTVRRYSEDPGMALNEGRIVEPLKEHRWKLEPLNHARCTPKQSVAQHPSKDITVTIRIAPLNHEKRRFDFDKMTIDGQPVLGTDGFPDPNYVPQNFKASRIVSDIEVKFGSKVLRAPKEKTFLLMRPGFERDSCVGSVHWVKDAGIVLIHIGGGDGAGSYSTYLMFGPKGFLAQYRDWCTTPSTYCAPHQGFFGKASTTESVLFLSPDEVENEAHLLSRLRAVDGGSAVQQDP